MTQWKNFRKFLSREKEKIEITIETKESWEINWLRKSRVEFCGICRAETIFISAQVLRQIVKDENFLFEMLLEEKNLHFQNDQNRENLICLTSVKKCLEIEK